MQATPFTPLEGILGGALIGLASALLLFANGRVAGISGILSRALPPARGDSAWRAAFLLGLPLGASAVIRATHDVHGFAIPASWSGTARKRVWRRATSAVSTGERRPTRCGASSPCG